MQATQSFSCYSAQGTVPTVAEYLQYGRDRLQGISFKTVINVNERLSSAARFDSLPDQRSSGSASVEVRLLDLVVWLEQFHGFFILASRLEQEAGGAQIWTLAAALQGHLLMHGQHVGP